MDGVASSPNNKTGKANKRHSPLVIRYEVATHLIMYDGSPNVSLQVGREVQIVRLLNIQLKKIITAAWL
jgi:hypothetical protein